MDAFNINELVFKIRRQVLKHLIEKYNEVYKRLNEYFRGKSDSSGLDDVTISLGFYQPLKSLFNYSNITGNVSCFIDYIDKMYPYNVVAGNWLEFLMPKVDDAINCVTGASYGYLSYPPQAFDSKNLLNRLEVRDQKNTVSAMKNYHKLLVKLSNEFNLNVYIK